MTPKTPSRPQLVGARQQRIHDLLSRLVSEGVADFFADACGIQSRDYVFRTKSHIVSHLIREVESGVREVLKTLPAARNFLEDNPPANKGTHAAQVKAVLSALGLTNEAVAEKWRSFAGDEGWHSTAHRRVLGRPRSYDAEFAARFDRMVDVLAVDGMRRPLPPTG